jgi:hypothetical protein
MAVDPRRLLAVFKKQCEDIPERVPKYRDELLVTIADVIAAEREHMLRATQVQQRITDFCARLGDFIASEGQLPTGKTGRGKRK